MRVFSVYMDVCKLSDPALLNKAAINLTMAALSFYAHELTYKDQTKGIESDGNGCF